MNQKHQAPGSKLQRSSKSQAPILHLDDRRRRLKFGAWSFSGAWILVLGGFICAAGLALASDTRPASLTNQIYLIPFSHLDLMWAGTREECLSRGSRIIAKAIELCRRQPEFRFLLEDEVFVANYVEAHRGSAELDEFKKLVKQGRIELAPKWAAIYQNLPRGEALVRNIIYGKQYARENFQVDPQVAHFGDIPGFTQQIPQILAKSDIPYMVMTRMGPSDNSLFRYGSPDGSTALVWNTIKGYGWGVGLGLHHADIEETNINKIIRSIGEIQATTQSPIYLGWGTDLFAPSENLVANAKKLSDRLAPLQFHVATPSDFFRAVTETSGSDSSRVTRHSSLVTLSGEIPSGWGNLITSMCHLWPPAMAAADALVTAEKFAAINFALGYADYPQKEFETLWKNALEVMDHNNFGQGAYIGDARKLEYAATATMRSSEILRQSLRNIAERVRSPFPRSTPIVVFNPSSWTRDDIVSAHVSVYGDVSPGDIGDYRKATRVVDETGTPVPYYVQQSYGMVSRATEIFFIARGVPSLGYKTYFMVPADKTNDFPKTCQAKMEDPDGKNPKRVLGADELENEFYRITVDRVTGHISVFDKELQAEVMKDMEITAAEERGGNSISIEPVTGRTLLNIVSRTELEENNAVRAVLRIDGEIGGTTVTQRLFLYPGLKKIDLENTVDWQEGRNMRIEQVFPCPHLQKSQVRYGIPYGSAEGADIMPKTGPRGGDEISREEWKPLRQIQDWVFVGTPESGLTICADRQLVSLGEDNIRFGMMRSTYSTMGMTRAGKQTLVPVPPPGKYIFRYSLTSARGGWKAAKSYRAGMAFSTPLIPVTSVDELSPKSLPPTHSFCSLPADNLVLTALKKAEKENAVVLRLVEMEGTKAETPVEFDGHKSRFRTTNLLEEETPSSESQTLPVSPYQIITVRLANSGPK
jgi:alpha-mannosidase